MQIFNTPFLIIIAVIAVCIFILSGYVKASPDKAWIISGIRKKPKILIGKAGIKVPFFEKKDYLLAKQISVDIKTGGYIPTKDFIGVEIDAIAKIQLIISNKPEERELTDLAMRNFLNMNEERIVNELTDSLQGNMREIIGTVTLQQLCTDRKQFGNQLQDKAQVDMKKLGVHIITCTIQKIADKENLITALGQDNMSQIQKSATIARAEAEMEMSIRQSETKEEANKAEVKANEAIATRENDLKIKQAELKAQSDAAQAKADASYTIQKELERKNIEIAKTEADIAQTEKQTELKAKEVEVQEKSLDATIRKKAEAERFQREQNAEARLTESRKEAEAEQYRREREADATRAEADAALYAAKQDAEGIRLKGIAEAEAIKAKGLAEATAIEKKAEGMAKMKQASVLEMYFKVLPQIAENVAKPLQSVDRITMYGEGNATKMIKDVTNSTMQITDGLTEGLGLDLKSIIGQLGGMIGNKAAEESPNVEPDTKPQETDESTFKEVTEEKVEE